MKFNEFKTKGGSGDDFPPVKTFEPEFDNTENYMIINDLGDEVPIGTVLPSEPKRTIISLIPPGPSNPADILTDKGRLGIPNNFKLRVVKRPEPFKKMRQGELNLTREPTQLKLPGFESVFNKFDELTLQEKLNIVEKSKLLDKVSVKKEPVKQLTEKDKLKQKLLDGFYKNMQIDQEFDKKNTRQKKVKIKDPLITIWDNNPWPFSGSYTEQELKQLGFRRFSSGYKVSKSDYHALAKKELQREDIQSALKEFFALPLEEQKQIISEYNPVYGPDAIGWDTNWPWYANLASIPLKGPKALYVAGKGALKLNKAQKVDKAVDNLPSGSSVIPKVPKVDIPKGGSNMPTGPSAPRSWFPRAHQSVKSQAAADSADQAIAGLNNTDTKGGGIPWWLVGTGLAGLGALYLNKKRKDKKKEKDSIKESVPSNDKVEIINKLLADKFPANDIKKQMDAYFAIPDPEMLDAFRARRSEGGDDECLRPILRNYVKQQLDPKLQKQVNLNESNRYKVKYTDRNGKQHIVPVGSLSPRGAIERARFIAIAKGHKRASASRYSGTSTDEFEIVENISEDFTDVDQERMDYIINTLENNPEFVRKVYRYIKVDPDHDGKLDPEELLSKERTQPETDHLATKEILRAFIDALMNTPGDLDDLEAFLESYGQVSYVDTQKLMNGKNSWTDWLIGSDSVGKEFIENLYINLFNFTPNVLNSDRGPGELGLALLSPNIKIANVGDLSIDGVEVEVKGERSVGGGRLRNSNADFGVPQMDAIFDKHDVPEELRDVNVSGNAMPQKTHFLDVAQKLNEFKPGVGNEYIQELINGIYIHADKDIKDNFIKQSLNYGYKENFIEIAKIAFNNYANILKGKGFEDILMINLPHKNSLAFKASDVNDNLDQFKFSSLDFGDKRNGGAIQVSMKP